MMSPKSDAGLSSGPALAGFGAFGQQAGNPSSALAETGTAAAFGTSGSAFGGMPSFAAPGVAILFGSTDSRTAGASAGVHQSSAATHAHISIQCSIITASAGVR